MKLRIPTFFICSSLFVGMCFAQLNAPFVPADQFKQHVVELQKSPGDLALREKIIKLALTLDPKPEIPEDARRFVARGQAALESAKDPDDFKAAAQEFEKAALAAPWLAVPYNNLALVQEKAGDYPAAIRNLKLYLLAAPNASDAEQAKSLIYKLGYKQEKIAQEKEAEQRRVQTARAEQRRRDEAAAAERQRQEQAAAKQRAEAERIERGKEEKRKVLRAKYGGAVWANPIRGVEGYSALVIHCDGKILQLYTEFENGGRGSERFLIDLADWDGSEFALQTEDGIIHKYAVSADGRTITERFSRGSSSTNADKWSPNIYKRRK